TPWVTGAIGVASALKGRYNFYFALSGLTGGCRIATQGVALGWFIVAPSGQIQKAAASHSRGNRITNEGRSTSIPRWYRLPRCGPGFRRGRLARRGRLGLALKQIQFR